jgi:arginase family enzyme
MTPRVDQIKIFGAALDALSSIERVNLKQAYLQHVRKRPFIERGFEDPYDFVKGVAEQGVLNNNIEWVGKISIPSWLTPRPQVNDSSKLSVGNLDKFLESDKYWDYALMIADYIRREIYPGMPVMIGVDHSLTGGSVMALTGRHLNLNVVILDAHFDVMDTERGYEKDCQMNYYECGNFLDRLLKREIISPENLWILGVQDEIYREMNGRRDLGGKLNRSVKSIKKWMKAGVHVAFKHEVQSDHFKLDLKGPTYLSIDMDVGSMSAIYSARFMNSYGLNTAEFLQLLQKVSQCIRSSHRPLVGLDVMEFDVHFIEAIKGKKNDDKAEEIVREIFKLFIDKNRCKYTS